LLAALIVAGCRQTVERNAGEVVFLIESNPANLDPRYAVDGQSQRIGALLFSGLVKRDDEMNVHGDLAESWETPDALTYVFHLRKGVKFHDGREVTSKDVKATIEFMMNAANRSPKRGAFRVIGSIEAPDAYTVIFHLKEPSSTLLCGFSCWVCNVKLFAFRIPLRLRRLNGAYRIGRGERAFKALVQPIMHFLVGLSRLFGIGGVLIFRRGIEFFCHIGLLWFELQRPLKPSQKYLKF
jgi:peptide/nickel transport system substrate-binding protein